MISGSLEEYLKTIYILKNEKQEIRVTDIAERMNCTKPSVNKAVKSLQTKELVNYEVYGDIELTRERRKISKKNIRGLWYNVHIFNRNIKSR